MLLAEIHGKPCPEVEGIEDLITSAVFGHLRQVAPPLFWKDLFRRARTVAPNAQTLLSVPNLMNSSSSSFSVASLSTPPT